MHDTPTKLSAEVVTALSAALNALLAEAFALYHRTKELEWQLTAKQSREYHPLLDDQGEQILAIADALAERVRQIGGTTLIGHVTHTRCSPRNDKENLAPHAMLRQMVRDARALAAKLRETREVAVGKADLATTTLLEALVDEGERRIWFLSKVSRAAEARRFTRSSCRRAEAPARLRSSA